MSRPSERPLLLVTLLGLAGVQALVIGVLLLTAAPDGGAAQTAPQAAKALSAPPATIGRSEFDAWRDEAALGSPWAGVQLASALLDNYERSHDSEDLFEAIQWIDRGWFAREYQDSGIAARVFARHCGHKVLRWHWLCDRGE